VISKQKHLIRDLNIKKLMLAVVTIPLFAMFYHEAYAAANRPVHLVVGVIRKHDDNLFRQNKNEKSDNITGISAGLQLDKEFGLQRITAEANIIRSTYGSNDQLDYTSKNYKGTFYWALTHRLTGKIYADRDQKLNDFNDTQTELRNIRTTENQGFLADFNPSGGWHLLAGLSRQTLDNSETFNEDASFTANATDFGLKYAFPSSTTMKLMNHIRSGKYDNRTVSQANLFDNGYKEYETEAELDWSLSPKSTALFNISYIKREHDNFSARDYSGFQSIASYSWAPTEKIDVNLKASSKLASYQSNVDSYRRTNSISLKPKYAITPKINITGNVELSKRNFLGSGYQAPTQSDRMDKYKTAGIGAEWKPTLDSSLELNLSHYDQNSNVDQFDYKGNIASVSAEILF
jgi:exopolysaccharide biosynthesis operon protein EpsL